MSNQNKQRMVQLAKDIIGCCTGVGLFSYNVIADSDEQDNSWLIHISEGLTELVGGAADGANVFGGFSCDVSAVVAMLQPPDFGDFKSPPISLNVDIEDGASISIDGMYEGCYVSIMIYAEPLPDDVAMKANERGEMWPTGDEEDEEDDY